MLSRSQGMEDGVEAWDCLFEEDVLLVPWVIGFQGDNPMSSEIASHVGMSGKFFCRVCYASTGRAVKKDATEIERDACERERLKIFIKVRGIFETT